MARYVSKYARYIFTARTDREMVLADGQRQELQSAIHCHFAPWDVTEWEYESALEHFQFKGMPSSEPVLIEGQVGEAVSNPRFRISSYDTNIHNFDPETRTMVEGRLEGDPSYGTDFIRVDPPQLAPPWPSYDKLGSGGRGKTIEVVASEIASMVSTLGLNPPDVIYYERTNRNRPEVINALEKLIEVEEAAEAPVEIVA